MIPGPMSKIDFVKSRYNNDCAVAAFAMYMRWGWSKAHKVVTKILDGGLTEFGTPFEIFPLMWDAVGLTPIGTPCYKYDGIPSVVIVTCLAKSLPSGIGCHALYWDGHKTHDPSSLHPGEDPDDKFIYMMSFSAKESWDAEDFEPARHLFIQHNIEDVAGFARDKHGIPLYKERWKGDGLFIPSDDPTLHEVADLPSD